MDLRDTDLSEPHWSEPHLTELEMVEQAYGENTQRAEVERHLRSCRACAGQFAELERDLAGFNQLAAPVRDSGYGERVWETIASSLPAYTPQTQSWAGRLQSAWSGAWFKGLGYAAACALLVSGGFYAGQRWGQRVHPRTTAQLTSPAHPVEENAAAAKPALPERQPIVLVVLDDHLDRSERFLVQLKHADVNSSALASPMGDEARSLLAANQACRKNLAAKKNTQQDPELTAALGHLDQLLAEAANEPGGLNAAAIMRLQQEMNADGLLFEVRVLRSRMAHHSAASAGEDGAAI